MKRERHDPTTCLLSAKYAWKRSHGGNPYGGVMEALSWVWLMRWAGMPVYVGEA